LGLKLFRVPFLINGIVWLNGLWSPFGFETIFKICRAELDYRLNGLWSPFGFETFETNCSNSTISKG